MCTLISQCNYCGKRISGHLYFLKTPENIWCLTEILQWLTCNNVINKDFKKLPLAMHYHSLLTTPLKDTPKPLLVLIVKCFRFSLIGVWIFKHSLFCKFYTSLILWVKEEVILSSFSFFCKFWFVNNLLNFSWSSIEKIAYSKNSASSMTIFIWIK